MTLWLPLLLAVLALLCIPGPGEETPTLLGMPLIVWILFIALPMYHVVRTTRIIRIIFDGLDALCAFWFRWHRWRR